MQLPQLRMGSFRDSLCVAVEYLNHLLEALQTLRYSLEGDPEIGLQVTKRALHLADRALDSLQPQCSMVVLERLVISRDRHRVMGGQSWRSSRHRRGVR